MHPPTKSSLIGSLFHFLKWPGAEHTDMDSVEGLHLHRAIIRQKPFLRRLYLSQYECFVQNALDLSKRQGQILEMGSGSGFLKDFIPEIITSDICPDPSIDQTIDAAKLPFADHSLKAIFMTNVLHHLPDVESFFKEADRCLVRQGRLVMIEPTISTLGRWFYTHLHHEVYDETQTGWQLSSSGGRMSRSNQALPGLIFSRDRKRFESQFPHLRIVSIEKHTTLCFMLSGGLSWRALAPAWSYDAIQRIDRLLSKAPDVFPLFQTIVLEKQ